LISIPSKSIRRGVARLKVFSQPLKNKLAGIAPRSSNEYATHIPILVGIDSYNIDNTEGGSRPAHSILLRHNIPIVEHLCGLRDLPDTGFKFFAVPVKVKNFGTFPVRAFAVVAKKN